MTPPPVSLIIVSRGRPAALARCVTAVMQLWYRPLEVIVVADRDGIARVSDLPTGASVKQVRFEEANIARARNAGIAAASGQIIAFIDDDAVPEPSWLNYLVAPFSDPAVAIVGGFVKGRNGISWQWQGRSVDAWGHTHEITTKGSEPLRVAQEPGHALKTEGTNMAVRAGALRNCGGFDPAFQYFLDETDLNLRLASFGLVAAIAPQAVVHHGFAENETRQPNRAPRDLFQIGASWAVFLAKHCPKDQIAARWHDIRETERKRLIAYMRDGRVDPWDVSSILKTLENGYAEGSRRTIVQQAPPLRGPNGDFQPLDAPVSMASERLEGRPWNRGTLTDRARAKVAAGKVATVMVFSPTTLFHRVRFSDFGIWEQTGGLFGKSLRTDPIWRFWRFGDRVRREWALAAPRHQMKN